MWPAKSPDLSPLDFWFWELALAELRRSPPSSLYELKLTAGGFVESLNQEEIRRTVRHLRSRARVYRDLEGAAFEGKMKRELQHLNEGDGV